MLKSVAFFADDSRGHSSHRNTLTYSRSLSREQDPGKYSQRYYVVGFCGWSP